MAQWLVHLNYQACVTLFGPPWNVVSAAVWKLVNGAVNTVAGSASAGIMDKDS